MGREFSQANLDQLFSAPDVAKFVAINGYLAGSGAYDRGQPTYGFPMAVFVFKESLIWFSQSIQSGARTYYKATPPARQAAMLQALSVHAPEELAFQYARGMKDWRNKPKIACVDHWIRSREDVCHRWLWHHVLAHRQAIESLCGRIAAY
jgi:hypothetical protein